MADGVSVINMGDLSKPATVLIQKISDALGGYFKPYQIKRIAKAEAEARTIEAQTQIEITDIQRRALIRWIGEESRKQLNIEAITSMSFPYLAPSSNPQNMDDDWIANFFDKCRIVSDEQMQLLWGRILAGEANTPGSFSKRTINLLSSVDKTEAQQFTSLCGFYIDIDNNPFPLVYSTSEAFYIDQGITFDTLTHLVNIGLVNYDELAGFVARELAQNIDVIYHGKTFKVTLNTADQLDATKYQMTVGVVLFTHVGIELAKICKSTPIDGFVDYFSKTMRQQGLIVSLQN